jgi:adenosylcobyric acid synthase
MRRDVLMVQGTTSDAGKSIMVAGICRLLARQRVNVAPFKPQNMALNSAVTVDGGEIGRAQALQAQACFIEPTVDMNPILLKPEKDSSAQVIIQGKAQKRMDAKAYHLYKKEAMGFVLESLSRLQTKHDVIVVEGAGSPAEINLRGNDIANMGFAEASDCPVILVADIDRGGVFATVVGTLQLLSKSERERVKGIVINRFRGDIGLLLSGIRWLEEEVNKPVLGVLPYLKDFYLDAEDAIVTDQKLQPSGRLLKVTVIVFSRISNHTDFDPLRQHPGVDLRYTKITEQLPESDLIILPGSKNVRADLAELITSSLHESIRRHLRYGGKLLGICGGFQMLGNKIIDKEGVEDEPGESIGLGLLSMRTELKKVKQLRQRRGRLFEDSVSVSGYEIHCGSSVGSALERPLIIFDDGERDGAISADNQIAGTYLHGLFDEPEAGHSLLRWAGLESNLQCDINQLRESQLERLADALDEHVDLSSVLPEFFLENKGRAPWAE